MKLKKIISIAIIAALIIGVWVFFAGRNSANERYRTEKVDRGNIVEKVSANGTLNPVTVVNVGTQVSGTIAKLYVDFNSQVKKGDALADLDQSLFNAQLGQSQANLKNAQATLKLAELNYRRSRELKAQNYIAQAELDKASQDLESARAQVDLYKSQVEKDQVNLRYSHITSPVSGVVVSRAVDLGQTVAASFQTPTLFKIAEDLSKMQIIASVSEADVGNIKEGQVVSFTVDAHRDREFEGRVNQIRLDPQAVQNVVTYNVVIDVENKDNLLLPGMTAFVNILIAEHNDVLRVSNSAFQYRPMAKTRQQTTQVMKNEPGEKKIYVLRRGKAEQVRVMVGISNNQHSEIKSGDIKEGDEVIIEEIIKNKSQPRSNPLGGGSRRIF